MKRVVIEMRLGAELREEDLVRSALAIAKTAGVADASYAVKNGVVTVRDGLGNEVGSAKIGVGHSLERALADEVVALEDRNKNLQAEVNRLRFSINTFSSAIEAFHAIRKESDPNACDLGQAKDPPRCYRHGYLGEVGGACEDSQGKPL